MTREDLIRREDALYKRPLRLWYCSRTGYYCEYAGEQYCHMTVCDKEQGTYKTCIEVKTAIQKNDD